MSLSSTIELCAGVTEEAISIPVDGETIRGNLVRGRGDLGVVIIHGYGGVRSGPHNLLTSIARSLASEGVSSIRFDLRGRGESDGLPQATTLAGMAEDSLAAAAALKRECQVTKIGIVGICSGGNVGIGILDRLPEVTGLFLLSVYPFGEADSFKRDAHRSMVHLKEYWRKLWLPETWSKLLRGEINYGIILKVVTKPLKRLSKKKPAESFNAQARPARPLDNLLIKRPKLCMLYGDTDPDFAASTAYYREFADEEKYELEIRTITGANHNFYSYEWKEQIKRDVLQFIRDLS